MFSRRFQSATSSFLRQHGSSKLARVSIPTTTLYQCQYQYQHQQVRTIRSMKARLEIPTRPKLTHEETERLSQGNISDFDIFQDLASPMNTIEVVLSNGFRLKNGIHFRCTDPINHPSALVLLSTETFQLDLSPENEKYDEKKSTDLNSKSQQQQQNHQTNINPNCAIKGIETGFVEFDQSALQFLEIIHPKPELLVVGLGKKSRMLHPNTRKFITGLGIQIELSTTVSF